MAHQTHANALSSVEAGLMHRWQHVQVTHVALGLAANVAAADLSLGLVECALGLRCRGELRHLLAMIEVLSKSDADLGM